MRLDEMWNEALTELAGQMTRATFETWLNDSTAINLDDNTLTVQVKNEFAVDWLTKRLLTIIETTVNHVARRNDIKVTFKAAPYSTQKNKYQTPGPEPKKSPITAPPAIEVVHFDPVQAGWLKVGHYANLFWRAYLGSSPFDLWLILNSLAQVNSDSDHIIQVIANIYANGNRARVLGRTLPLSKQTSEHKRQIGDLEILEREGLVWYRINGAKRAERYTIKVRGDLPLLTPEQIQQLPINLQDLHERFIKRCSFEYDEWEQLRLDTLLTNL